MRVRKSEENTPMTFNRNEIMPGVWLTCITTDKFKSGCLSINMITQLQRETASLNALIPMVLRRGCKSYPDMESFAGRLDDLYGAGISPTVRKIGEIQSVGLIADFVDGGFVPNKNLFDDVLSLMGEVLLQPAMRKGCFLEEYVESEKEKQLDRLRGRINDKRSYAIQRIIECMCSFEDFAISRLGDEESTENITADSLTQQYYHLLETAPMEVFYVGSCSYKTVRSKLRTMLGDLPRGELDYDIGTDIRMNSVEPQPRYFEDEMAVTQGKLSLGFRLGEIMDDPDYAALYVMNALYGGAVTSKLFMNVREKLSLCYYASSMVDVNKGIMLVYSGIDFDKYEVAYDEILAQLEAVKNGDFTDDDLDYARQAVAAELRTYMDSERDLEHYWLPRNLRGEEYDPMELSALVDTVSREDVIYAARGIVLDAVYFLKGSEEGIVDEEE